MQPNQLLIESSEPGVFDYLIDNSSLEVFNSCARSAQFKLVNKKIPAGRRSPLEFGKAAHNALELRYSAGGGQINDFMRQEVIAKGVRYLQVDSVPEPDDWRNADQMRNLLTQYLKTYEVEPFDILAVEKPFSLPLCEIPIDLPDPQTGKQVKTIRVYWTGKIDIVAENFRKSAFVLDHKTTSMLGATFWKQFELSNQMMGYCWAATQIYERPVYSVMINVLGSRKPTKTGKGIELDRNSYHYRVDQIESWKVNTETLVADFLSHYFRSYFPMQTMWCVGKYGTCPYHDVCSLPLPQQPTILNSGMYETDTWSPLNDE
jgi:hypothetical protein